MCVALQVPKVFHDGLVLYALKHLLGMVLELGLTAIDEGCQGIKLLHISVVEACLRMFNREKDGPLST